MLIPLIVEKKFSNPISCPFISAGDFPNAFPVRFSEENKAFKSSAINRLSAKQVLLITFKVSAPEKKI